MKKIKILTIILAVVLIIMVGFFGVYTQVQNRMENQLKDYSYAMDLKGTRNIILSVNEDSKTLIKDAEGKEVEDADNLTDEEIAEKGYVKEEVPYNKEEVKTQDNYKKSKEIIENRLKQIGVDNYILRFNETSGTVALEVTENEQVSDISNIITTTGEFEIKDSETDEELLNNDKIKSATVTSDQTEEGMTIYLQLELNEEGSKKIEEIKSSIASQNSNDKEKEDESNNTEDETKTETENETTNSSSEEETQEGEEEEANESEEDSEESTEKTGKVTFDSQEIGEISFLEQNNPQKIRIAIGSQSTNTTTINQNANEASYIAFMINTKNLPIVYEVTGNQYILSDITNNELQIAMYIALGIIALGIVILIFKYKLSGLLVAISYIGFIASFGLVIRYTNVILSIEGFLAIGIVLILSYLLIMNLLKKSYKMETYKEFLIKILPIIVLSIVFCFVNWVPMSSFGMILFWGIILLAIYNMLITSNLIKIKEGKDK